MKNLTLNQICYVIDDLTNNVTQARITNIDNNGITLVSTANDPTMTYMRKQDDIYDTAAEAHANREPIAMITEAELRMEIMAYTNFDSKDYIPF